MGRPTWRPHPGRNATRRDWIEAIALLTAETRLYRQMTAAAIIGAAIGALIIIVTDGGIRR